MYCFVLLFILPWKEYINASPIFFFATLKYKLVYWIKPGKGVSTMQITTRTKHSHQGKNKPPPFVYSPFTGHYRAGRYLDYAGVHMCESKAEQKLAVHEQEMRCAGFAMTNRSAVSGRETV